MAQHPQLVPTFNSKGRLIFKKRDLTQTPKDKIEPKKVQKPPKPTLPEKAAEKEVESAQPLQLAQSTASEEPFFIEPADIPRDRNDPALVNYNDKLYYSLYYDLRPLSVEERTRHYLETGIFETRIATYRQLFAKIGPDLYYHFDHRKYWNEYEDLQLRYKIEDRYALLLHYVNHGVNESRKNFCVDKKLVLDVNYWDISQSDCEDSESDESPNSDHPEESLTSLEPVCAAVVSDGERVCAAVVSDHGEPVCAAVVSDGEPVCAAVVSDGEPVWAAVASDGEPAATSSAQEPMKDMLLINFDDVQMVKSEDLTHSEGTNKEITTNESDFPSKQEEEGPSEHLVLVITNDRFKKREDKPHFIDAKKTRYQILYPSSEEIDTCIEQFPHLRTVTIIEDSIIDCLINPLNLDHYIEPILDNDNIDIISPYIRVGQNVITGKKNDTSLTGEINVAWIYLHLEQIKDYRVNYLRKTKYHNSLVMTINYQNLIKSKMNIKEFSLLDKSLGKTSLKDFSLLDKSLGKTSLKDFSLLGKDLGKTSLKYFTTSTKNIYHINHHMIHISKLPPSDQTQSIWVEEDISLIFPSPTCLMKYGPISSDDYQKILEHLNDSKTRELFFVSMALDQNVSETDQICKESELFLEKLRRKGIMVRMIKGIDDLRGQAGYPHKILYYDLLSKKKFLGDSH